MIGVGAAYTDLHPSLLALAPALQNQVGRRDMFFCLSLVLVFFLLISRRTRG